MDRRKGSGRDIWYVVKDPGGTNGVLPIREQTRAMGLSDLLIANGKAVELLQGKEEFVAAENALEVLAAHELPKVVVTSMCSDGGVGRGLSSILQERVPVIGVQDFWGARLWTAWANPGCWPHAIIVNDRVGAKILGDAWKGYGPERIWITGYPAQDKYFGFDVPGTGAKVKSDLGLTHDWPLVLWGGQVKLSGEIFREFVSALDETGQSVYLISRQHPRMKDDAPEEVPKVEEALANFRSGEIVDASGYKDILPLLAASDLVVSIFSTVLVDAAAIGRQNISVLYPETGMKRFLEETGGGMKEFPLVELACSKKAMNRRELISALASAFEGGLGLEAAQAETFKLDGKNAERVAKRVATLIA